MFELLFVSGFFLINILIYLVATVTLCFWVANKKIAYDQTKTITINGIFDLLCLIGVCTNFFIVLPIGLMLSLAIKVETTSEGSKHIQS